MVLLPSPGTSRKNLQPRSTIAKRTHTKPIPWINALNERLRPKGRGISAVRCGKLDHLNTPRLIVNQSNTITWRWNNTNAFGANMPFEDSNGNGTLSDYHPRFDRGWKFDGKTNYWIPPLK